MTGLSQDRASNGAHEAHGGHIPPDSRRRTGSAGDAALSGRDRASCHARAAGVLKLFLSGKTEPEIARALGRNVSGIHQMLRRDPDHCAQVKAEVTRRARSRAQAVRAEGVGFLREYLCGFSVGEIGRRHGRANNYIQGRLLATGQYVPRRRGSNGGLSFRVPDWVPTEHIDRWRRLAGMNGTEIADRCICNMLTWEAR